MSSDTLQASGIEPARGIGRYRRTAHCLCGWSCSAGRRPYRAEPPPRVAVEPPPARASAAFRLPPPVDPFLERQMQQQLAQLAAAPPPEPEEHRKGFVLFQAMPGGLFSAIVHMLVFLVLSVYVVNDPTGTKFVSLSVVDSDQDDTDVDEFVEMIVEEPSAAEEEPLEVAPDQAFLDNVVLDPPEIAHPEVLVPEPENRCAGVGTRDRDRRGEAGQGLGIHGGRRRSRRLGAARRPATAGADARSDRRKRKRGGTCPAMAGSPSTRRRFVVFQPAAGRPSLPGLPVERSRAVCGCAQRLDGHGPAEALLVPAIPNGKARIGTRLRPACGT